MRICPTCGETYPTSVKARWWKCFCFRKREAIQKLLERTEISDSGCLIYTGPNSGEGYGAFAMAYKRKNTRNLHRTAYLIFKGEIPDGMDVHHNCRTKRCWNPDHLELKPVPEHRRIHQCVTHCAHGHEYTEQNTYMLNGTKKCRACHRLRQRTKTRISKGWDAESALTTAPLGNKNKTHCKNGHPFSGDNLQILANGKRRCRACHLNWRRRDAREKYHATHPGASISPFRKATF